MPYDDDEEEVDSADKMEREVECPACKTTFKTKVRDIQGRKTVKCINTECGKEISLVVKPDETSQFDRAMKDLDRTLDGLGDFKIDF